MNRKAALSWARAYIREADKLLYCAELNDTQDQADTYIAAATILVVKAASIMAPFAKKDSET